MGDLDLNVWISGYIQKGYGYEVVEREMAKHGAIGKRKRRKWNRGVLYHNRQMIAFRDIAQRS